MADFASGLLPLNQLVRGRRHISPVLCGNRQQAAEATLDGDPVADLARALVKTAAIWTGTAS